MQSKLLIALFAALALTACQKKVEEAAAPAMEPAQEAAAPVAEPATEAAAPAGAAEGAKDMSGEAKDAAKQ